MKKAVAIGIAFIIGAAFMVAFFHYNDPDRVALPVTVKWAVAILFPSSLLLSLIAYKASRASVMSLLAGIFVGTCIAIFTIYPNRANLFPIAASLWTVIMAIPVILGGVIGSLAGRRMYRKREGN